MLFLNLIPFAVSTWLGLFLLSRGSHPRLRWTAAGLLFYAAAIISNDEISRSLRLFPPAFWVGAIVHLDQRVLDRHPISKLLWRWILLPLTILLGGFFLLNPSAAQSAPFTWISLAIGLAPLFWTLSLMRDYIAILKPKRATGILFVATLFFAFGEGFLLLPLEATLEQYVLPAIGIDLLFLGYCMAWFDAFDEGEAFLPEMIRSFVLTATLAIILAGQVGFVIAIQTGLTAGMEMLLITTVASSIVVAVFGNSIQRKLDLVASSRNPSVREARARLQTESVSYRGRIRTSILRQ